MHLVTEIHAFDAINAAGETITLGSLDATGDECISELFAGIVRANPRFAGLAPAIDQAFHACERIPGDNAVGEAAAGSITVRCTRTIH